MGILISFLLHLEGMPNLGCTLLARYFLIMVITSSLNICDEAKRGNLTQCDKGKFLRALSWLPPMVGGVSPVSPCPLPWHVSLILYIPWL